MLLQKVSACCGKQPAPSAPAQAHRSSHLASLANATPLTPCCQRLTELRPVTVRPSWYQGQIKISWALICSWILASRRHLTITKAQHHKTSLPESNWWLSLWRTHRPGNKLAFPRLCRMMGGKTVPISTPGKWPGCQQQMDAPAAISALQEGLCSLF